jgi:hypothetical protein
MPEETEERVTVQQEDDDQSAEQSLTEWVAAIMN